MIETSCVFGMVKICKYLCDKEIGIFKKFDFCSYPPAHLIDFEPQISRISQINTDLGQKKREFLDLTGFWIIIFPIFRSFSFFFLDIFQIRNKLPTIRSGLAIEEGIMSNRVTKKQPIHLPPKFVAMICAACLFLGGLYASTFALESKVERDYTVIKNGISDLKGEVTMLQQEVHITRRVIKNLRSYFSQ